MYLADGGITFVWFGGVLLIGFVGFVAVLLGALARVIRFVLRALFGGGDLETAGGRVAAWPQTCGRPRCGHLNPPGARFCARCGHALDDPDRNDNGRT